MDFHLKDLYPNIGEEDTRTEVQPEAGDQTALVDDQKVAHEYSKNPKAKFNIFVALGALVIVAVVMGVTK